MENKNLNTNKEVQMVVLKQLEMDGVSMDTKKNDRDIKKLFEDDQTESSDDDHQQDDNLDGFDEDETSDDDSSNKAAQVDVQKFEKVRQKRIHKFLEKLKPKERVRIIEKDFLDQEEIKVNGDVYALTIAANMTQACSPIELLFSIKLCVLVFLFQCAVAMYWVTDFLDNKQYQYQPFTVLQTAISIICGVLFKMTIESDLDHSIEILTFLKRSKGVRSNEQGRFVNILLSFMQSTSFIITIFALVFTFTKEPALKMIIKSYATLAFVTKIDNAFAGSLPPSVIKNAKEMN